MTYSEKLQDPRWQKKRLDILNRDNWSCIYCGDNGSTLHVHHKVYSGEPWEAANDNLETCCKYCHATIEYHKSLAPGMNILRIKRYINSKKDIFRMCYIVEDEERDMLLACLYGYFIDNGQIEWLCTIKEDTVFDIVNLLKETKNKIKGPVETGPA